jgi:protein-tyrosine kinase
MSLVERALKKLQEAGATSHRATLPEIPVAHAAAVDPERRPASADGSAARLHAAAPTRVVKIDRTALRAKGLLPPIEMERGIGSQYQQIKRPLIAAALGKGDDAVPRGHLLMLTSALPGEGKTFTSVNLALSMALERDVEVLLVDADVAKPHVTNLFGLNGERGLLDLLTDSKLHPDSLILRTDMPGLSILPAGKQIETATELLASERMQEVVAMLSAPERRRVVLFDSPPLLLSTESVALLSSVGQIVMVVRAGQTARTAVLHALEIMGEGRRISLILNQITTPPSAGYYGYGTYGSQPGEQGHPAALAD